MENAAPRWYAPRTTATASSPVRTLVILLVLLVVVIVLVYGALALYRRLTQDRYDGRNACECTHDQLLSLLSTDEQHTQIRKLLRRVDRAFESAGARGNALAYWIIGGTLLGAVRDGTVIPWDDDADIGVLLEDWKKALASGRLEQAMTREGLVWQKSVVGGIARFALREAPQSTFLDVFAFRPASRTDPLLVPSNWYARKIFPAEQWYRDEVFPRRRVVLRKWVGHGTVPDDVEVWAPHASTRYLNAKYSNDGQAETWREEAVVSRHDSLTLLRPCRIAMSDFRTLFPPSPAGAEQ